MSTTRAPERPIPDVGDTVGWAGLPATVVGYQATRTARIRTEKAGRLTYVVLDVAGYVDLRSVRPAEVTLDPNAAGGRIPARLLRKGDRILYVSRTIPVVDVAPSAHGTLVSISPTERVDFGPDSTVLIAPRSAA